MRGCAAKMAHRRRAPCRLLAAIAIAAPSAAFMYACVAVGACMGGRRRLRTAWRDWRRGRTRDSMGHACDVGRDDGEGRAR